MSEKSAKKVNIPEGDSNQTAQDKPCENEIAAVDAQDNSEEGNIHTKSPERARSPELDCSICLGKLQNKSFTDSCFHTFCFTCLQEWSKVKPVCPLCKQPFKSIIHNVRSIEDYDQYDLRNNNDSGGLSPNANRFRYRTTLTQDRWLLRQHRDQSRQLRLLQQPSIITTRTHWRRFRQTATSDFRRRVYSTGLRVQAVTQAADRPARHRNISPEFFRRNPACSHRLVPWLNRELNVLLHNHEDHMQFVLELILDMIKTYEIGSEVFRTHLDSFMGRRTDHFVHEFLHFARSPYDMCTYDARAVYHVNPENADPLSVLTVESSSDSEIDDIIVLSPTGEEMMAAVRSNSGDHSYFSREVTTEPAAERRGNTIDNNPTPNPLIERVRDFLSGVDPADTAHSGWESPLPGPSTLDWSPPNPGSPTTGDGDENKSIHNISDESDDIQIVSNIDGTADIVQQQQPGPSKVMDSDSEDDCMIMGFDKPFEDRSPIPLSSEDDLEVLIAIANSRRTKKEEDKKKKRAQRPRSRTPLQYRVRSKSRSTSRSRRRSSSRSRRRSRSTSRRRSRSRSRCSSRSRDRSRRSRSRSRSRTAYSSSYRDRRKRSRSRDFRSFRSRSRDRRDYRRRSRSRSREHGRYGGTYNNSSRYSRRNDRRSRSRSRSSGKRRRSRSGSRSYRNDGASRHGRRRSRSSSVEYVGSRRGGKDRSTRQRADTRDDRRDKRRRRSDSIELLENDRTRSSYHRDTRTDSSDHSRRRHRSRSREARSDRDDHNCKKHPSGHKKSSNANSKENVKEPVLIKKIKLEPASWTIVSPEIVGPKVKVKTATEQSSNVPPEAASKCSSASSTSVETAPASQPRDKNTTTTKQSTHVSSNAASKCKSASSTSTETAPASQPRDKNTTATKQSSHVSSNAASKCKSASSTIIEMAPASQPRDKNTTATKQSSHVSSNAASKCKRASSTSTETAPASQPRDKNTTAAKQSSHVSSNAASKCKRASSTSTETAPASQPRDKNTTATKQGSHVSSNAASKCKSASPTSTETAPASQPRDKNTTATKQSSHVSSNAASKCKSASPTSTETVPASQPRDKNTTATKQSSRVSSNAASKCKRASSTSTETAPASQPRDKNTTATKQSSHVSSNAASKCKSASSTSIEMAPASQPRDKNTTAIKQSSHISSNAASKCKSASSTSTETVPASQPKVKNKTSTDQSSRVPSNTAVKSQSASCSSSETAPASQCALKSSSNTTSSHLHVTTSSSSQRINSDSLKKRSKSANECVTEGSAVDNKRAKECNKAVGGSTPAQSSYSHKHHKSGTSKSVRDERCPSSMDHHKHSTSVTSSMAGSTSTNSGHQSELSVQQLTTKNPVCTSKQNPDRTANDLSRVEGTTLTSPEASCVSATFTSGSETSAADVTRSSINIFSDCEGRSVNLDKLEKQMRKKLTSRLKNNNDQERNDKDTT